MEPQRRRIRLHRRTDVQKMSHVKNKTTKSFKSLKVALTENRIQMIIYVKQDEAQNLQRGDLEDNE